MVRFGLELPAVQLVLSVYLIVLLSMPPPSSPVYVLMQGKCIFLLFYLIFLVDRISSGSPIVFCKPPVAALLSRFSCCGGSSEPPGQGQGQDHVG